ncbi:hypothetical protein GUITHDRAFT_158272 [Guillardia theta CCMP2712]|uniref:Band 7 domain-containing protein n=1 Tax=Guillardia theta (strain CCMP2712) TaxID=905079 RepID=L1IX03_GUITC|nr:hypothetical protein GUITHDRAFT_158272 [Guillardia theta CCMP2712]EKX40773.1 hypothetical protein GUITHDRAFT_158272 [Guillardia theta CCMP2712]|eukprot:XP_005827753.1 hypothetical protein GUITHDRAFT_158272 [Guillardia theta CCMP2712]
MSFLCCTCVDQSQRGILQTCGKFTEILNPGFSFVYWPFQTVDFVSIKVTQINVNTHTKTKDNVTVTVTCAIQYSVTPQECDDYYFKLHNPHMQISAYVDDCIRSQIPTMTLDESFESKESMADAVKSQVAHSMEPYGIEVHQALITNMQPDATVMAAMNKINAARRQREAAIEKAEADKILQVRAAEAEAEAKHLSGKGTAMMRHAITNGFKSSIESMQESCGLQPSEVVHMMLVTQYMDVLKDFAQSGRATMVVPHGPSALSDVEQQVRGGFQQSLPMTSNSMI